jgi:phosphoesterase RecJ-like protein
MGKKSYVLIEDKIPGYLKFLDDRSCTYDLDIIEEPDVCICIDCADIERFTRRKDKFFQGRTTMCVDHHKTSECFADYNYIDSGAAASGEIVYELLCEMGADIDKTSGEAIYAAIITDTGNYQYSNTRAESHLITVDLFDIGIDRNYVSMMLYQNTRIEKLHISGRILNTINMLANGEAVMAYVTRDMLSEAGALMEDTEGASEMLRNISGVELSIFVKETGPGETKFSMRSKKWADATELTTKYKGGGHTRAAGCTMDKPIFEAMEIMGADVEEYFSKHSGDR